MPMQPTGQRQSLPIKHESTSTILPQRPRSSAREDKTSNSRVKRADSRTTAHKSSRLQPETATSPWTTSSAPQLMSAQRTQESTQWTTSSAPLLLPSKPPHRHSLSFDHESTSTIPPPWPRSSAREDNTSNSSVKRADFRLTTARNSKSSRLQPDQPQSKFERGSRDSVSNARQAERVKRTSERELDNAADPLSKPLPRPVSKQLIPRAVIAIGPSKTACKNGTGLLGSWLWLKFVAFFFWLWTLIPQHAFARQAKSVEEVEGHECKAFIEEMNACTEELVRCKSAISRVEKHFAQAQHHIRKVSLK